MKFAFKRESSKSRFVLRSRSQYEYATSSHLHDHILIELDSLRSLIDSSISRINSTRMIMFRSLASEIENKQKISDENFTDESSTNSCRSRHEYD